MKVYVLKEKCYTKKFQTIDMFTKEKEAEKAKKELIEKYLNFESDYKIIKKYVPVEMYKSYKHKVNCKKIGEE